MRITGIDIRKLYEPTNSLKGIVSIGLDNELAVHDIKIIHSLRDFVQMPAEKRPEYKMHKTIPGQEDVSQETPVAEGTAKQNAAQENTVQQIASREEFRSIVHPISREFRKYIEETILYTYDKALADFNSLSEEDIATLTATGSKGIKHIDTTDDPKLMGIPVTYRVPWHKFEEINKKAEQDSEGVYDS